MPKDFHGRQHRFTACVGHHGPAVTRRVRDGRAAGEGRPDALCGICRGRTDASPPCWWARPGAGRRTWHTYPQSGHTVATQTRMEKT